MAGRVVNSARLLSRGLGRVLADARPAAGIAPQWVNQHRFKSASAADAMEAEDDRAAQSMHLHLKPQGAPAAYVPIENSQDPRPWVRNLGQIRHDWTCVSRSKIFLMNFAIRSWLCIRLIEIYY